MDARKKKGRATRKHSNLETSKERDHCTMGHVILKINILTLNTEAVFYRIISMNLDHVCRIRI